LRQSPHRRQRRVQKISSESAPSTTMNARIAHRFRLITKSDASFPAIMAIRGNQKRCRPNHGIRPALLLFRSICKQPSPEIYHFFARARRAFAACFLRNARSARVIFPERTRDIIFEILERDINFSSTYIV
jgi:hypothetical protein